MKASKKILAVRKSFDPDRHKIFRHPVQIYSVTPADLLDWVILSFLLLTSRRFLPLGNTTIILSAHRWKRNLTAEWIYTETEVQRRWKFTTNALSFQHDYFICLYDNPIIVLIMFQWQNQIVFGTKTLFINLQFWW